MKARDSEYTSVEAKKSMSSLARRSVKEEKGLYEDIVEQATRRNEKGQYVSWRSPEAGNAEGKQASLVPGTNGEEEWQRVVKERQTRVEGRRGRERRREGKGLPGDGCI